MGKYTLKIDKDRLLESRERIAAYYTGKPVDRAPFCYLAKKEKSLPQYSIREMVMDPDKAIEQFIAGVNHQFELFPDTDYAPSFFMNFFGPGAIASMYGAEMVLPEQIPPYTIKIMKDIYDLDKVPKRFDPNNDGWGPKMRDTVEKFLHACNGELPVALCDIQSPYGNATQLIDDEQFMYAMYDEPEAVHELMDIVTTGMEDIIDAFERWAGPEHVVKCADCFGIPNRPEMGLCLADDYISVLSPQLHKEFCTPYNVRLFDRYGHGHLHTCGPYFPGFIESCLACEPKSLDLIILRGMTCTKEDVLEMRRITRERGMVLMGVPQIKSGHYFDKKVDEMDEEFLTEIARGRWRVEVRGKAQDGQAVTAKWRRIFANAEN